MGIPIRDRVAEIKARIAMAARRAGRDPGEVTLVAVTKGVSVADMQEAVQGGARIFGESRVQEALSKRGALSEDPVVWHFIGPLQRKKVKQVVGQFDMIHSVDSIALAGEISERAERLGYRQRILLEVNVGGEDTKHGIAPEEVPITVEVLRKMPGLTLEGLMTLPPFAEDAEGVRHHFRRLKALSAELPGTSRALSMGMSHDFEVAVEEGATLVRVGSALFGSRL